MIDEEELKYEIMVNLHKERFQDYRTGAKGIYYLFDDSCSLIDNLPKIGEWISCSDRLPENSKHKGAFCPKYKVMTKYGETVGWYNPDFESWFVLMWFMTERYLTEEIDFERGDVPKIVRAPLDTNIVEAWKPLPDVYHEQAD